MSFYFELYRAPPGTAPLLRWESNLAEPLGTVEEVRARVAALLPELQWSKGADGIVMGQTRGLPVEAVGVILQPMEKGAVFFIATDGSPAVLRRLMSEFGLNCCCAQESGEMRDPFSVGATWAEVRSQPG